MDTRFGLPTKIWITPRVQTGTSVPQERESITRIDKRKLGNCAGVPQKAVDMKTTGLHGDGVVGVASYIPAGILVGVREKGARAGDVFFGLGGINFEIGFAIFVGNGEETCAVNRRRSRASFGVEKTNMKGEKVCGVYQKKESDERNEDAPDKRFGRAPGTEIGSGSGHVR
jgi:hypothetical protein